MTGDKNMKIQYDNDIIKFDDSNRNNLYELCIMALLFISFGLTSVLLASSHILQASIIITMFSIIICLPFVIYSHRSFGDNQ
jgi:hypothetical protein